MDVCVAIDHRFDRTPDGAMWTMTSFTYEFWTRYLSAFDRVRVVARVRDVDGVHTKLAPNRTRSDGPDVLFSPVPYYLGPFQYLQRARRVRQAAVNALGLKDAVILRVQGQIASCVSPSLRRTGRPYGVEVVGDPYDAFAPGYVTHPLRPFLQWWLPRRMGRQIAGACAATFVTAYTLQRRYPPAADALSTHYSSIVLGKEAFSFAPRALQAEQKRFTLVTVGTLDNLSKGPDLLIDAVSTCVKQGLDLHLVLVGGGKYQPQLEAQAKALGVSNRIHFVGWVSAGEAVRRHLDQADLFVMPSHQEGLSRATIEAMARGLPCIATTVGGTGELLPDEDMVPSNDSGALASKIREVLTDPERMAHMAARNLERSRAYGRDALSKRWTEFYRYIRERTEEWLQAKKTMAVGGQRKSIARQ